LRDGARRHSRETDVLHRHDHVGVEVQRIGTPWHRRLTVAPGVFREWNARRFIIHLTSRDGTRWTCGERLELGSERVIDAGAAALPEGGYRLWFNDKRRNRAIRHAGSPICRAARSSASSTGRASAESDPMAASQAADLQPEARLSLGPPQPAADRGTDRRVRRDQRPPRSSRRRAPSSPV
jgi:hypothetical protein